MPLELQHVPEVGSGESRDFLERAGHLLEVEPAAYGKVGRGSPGGSSDVCRPSARRFQGIGERDVLSVREEAHDWFWITGDVDTECVTECLDDITQIIALGRPAVGVPVDRPPVPALAAVHMGARSSVRSGGPPSLELM